MRDLRDGPESLGGMGGTPRPRAERGRGGCPLVLVPYLKNSKRYTVALHERIFAITDTQRGSPRASKIAPRGNVKGISSKSRYRLIKYLAKVSRPDEPVFITLTYREFLENFGVWKEALHAFHQALKYYFPLLCGFWRLEFQKRGAPHFHLLLWLGAEADVETLHETVTQLWCRVIGQTSEANLKYGATVERVCDFRKSAFYISVYQAKDAQDRRDICTGREWGIWGKARLGLEPVSSIAIDAPTLLLLRRTLRRLYVSFMRKAGRKTNGRYAHALKGNDCFSNFLPFYLAFRLVKWCEGESGAIALFAPVPEQSDVVVASHVPSLLVLATQRNIIEHHEP